MGSAHIRSIWWSLGIRARSTRAPTEPLDHGKPASFAGGEASWGGSGIQLGTYTKIAGWSGKTLPESAYGTVTGDCPDDALGTPDNNPCGTLTTCTKQLKGAATPFGLARTQSGATFVAWVEYTSEGAYTLENVQVQNGEMPFFACIPTETAGSAVAELVVARLAGSEPALSRFRFNLEGAIWNPHSDLQMVGRGDTLLVAARLSASGALTYLELDTKLLK